MKIKISYLTLIILVLSALLIFSACGAEEPIGGDPNSRDEVQMYTVSFDSAGGSAVAPVKVEDGGKVARPTDPVRDGYEFVGWIIDGETWSFVGYVVTEDMTLVAEWREIESTEGVEFEKKGDGYAVVNYTGEASEVVIQPFYRGEPVTEIENAAFGNDLHVKAVHIPYSVKRIASGSFPDQTLERVYVTDLAAWCGTDFDEAGILYGVEFYVDGRLATDITIPSEVEKIADFAFQGCKSIQSLTVCEGVGEVGYATFSSCHSLKSVILPDSLSVVSVFAFYDCSALETVELGCGVGELGTKSFGDCTSLKSINIPASLVRIGRGSFSGCTSLARIVLERTEGWFFTADHDYVGGAEIAVTTPEATAAAFVDTYRMRYIYRLIGELV